jgi:hypothetical protein
VTGAGGASRWLAAWVLLSSVLAAVACNKSSDIAGQSNDSKGFEATVKDPPQPGETQAEPRADIKADVVMKGDERQFVLVASAPPPFVLKSTTPFSVALSGDAGVQFAKSTLGREDYVDKDTPDKTVATKVTAPPGEHTIDADAELYVCSAELCKQVTQHLTARFSVPKS